jgi:hypothetical protein
MECERVASLPGVPEEEATKLIGDFYLMATRLMELKTWLIGLVDELVEKKGAASPRISG